MALEEAGQARRRPRKNKVGGGVHWGNGGGRAAAGRGACEGNAGTRPYFILKYRGHDPDGLGTRSRIPRRIRVMSRASGHVPVFSFMSPK